MRQNLFIILILLLIYKIQTFKEIEYKEEGTTGIFKINHPMKYSLNSKALEDKNDILDKINTEKISALIIDTILDISIINPMSSADEETQKLFDSYIKYWKKTNQKVEINHFPQIILVKVFLILVKGEVVKQEITGESKLYSTPDVEEMLKMIEKKP